jgi:hypothetical protein
MRKQHKEDNLGWKISFRKISVRGIIPKDSSFRGATPYGKIPMPLMTKGERFIRCKGKCKGKGKGKGKGGE